MRQQMQRHVGEYASLTPERPAIIMAASGRVVSFAEYEQVSNQCAQLLRALGLKRGDGVALLAHNHWMYLPLVWGAMRAGLRVTTIATHLTGVEVDYILTDSDVKAVFVSASLAGVAVALNAAPQARFSFDGPVDGYVSLEDALASHPSTPIADQSEGVEMLYSSGTTGRPKGVKKPLPTQPFGEVNPYNASMMARYGIDENTVYLSPAPLYHAAPLMFNIRINRFGGTSVLMDKFDAEAALHNIERFRVTHSQWVPTMFVRLLRLSESIRQQFDLSSHRFAIHAAAPCPQDIKREMIDWWGPILEEFYGGSEGLGTTAINSLEWLMHPGSVGRALIGELQICDEQGELCTTGETGLVCFTNGPKFEYHNDAEKTREAWIAPNCSTIGDMGYVDDEQYLYLTDRRAFVIISGGLNIYPQEAENRLVSHPDVVDAAVFGIPHAEFGEEVKAVVQMVAGREGSAAMAQRLLEYCRDFLSPVKCPRSIDFALELPREANGKLYKRKLRERYWP